MNGYLLWLGPVVDEEQALTNQAVSLATTRWQAGLLAALRTHGVPVQLLGWLPQRTWPYGPLMSMGDRRPGHSAMAVSYLNLPIMRETSQRLGLLQAIESLIASQGLPAATLTYNAPAPNIAVGRHMQRLGSPWIPIIADVPASEHELPAHDEAVREAAGRVYLSHESWRIAPDEPKLHLDGGVTTSWVESRQNRERALLFAGALNKYAGVGLLTDAFVELKDPAARLWICGKGDAGLIREALNRDRRITYFGPIPDAKLRELSERAWAFVNPRSMTESVNRHNFPSKVLEYLTYGKPVVSAWTPGLAPDYREVLYVYEREAPDELRRALSEVLALDEAALTAAARRIRGFLQVKKLWDVQARRLITWLEDQVLPHA